MNDPESGGAPLLAAEAIIAGYLPEVNILNGCDVHLAGGEIIGIIGPNGAGKSTLVKALFGLLPIRSGSIRLEGEEISDLPAYEMVARGVGYVPQNRNVFPSLTVEENLQMGLYQQPGRLTERMQVITSLFPLLAQRRGQRAGSLSGGERQVVAVARALMAEPKVLLLDEPSAGLSPVAQDDAFARIRAINEAGVSIVMVEQNARRCLEIAHRGYVLDQGRNAYTGTGRDLLGDDAVIELYLGTLARAR